MRLDKFLKVSRIIKRRTVAQQACDSSYVKVNGTVAKPSRTVSEGDIIEVAYGAKTTTFRVLKVQEHADKSSSAEMYEVI